MCKDLNLDPLLALNRAGPTPILRNARTPGSHAA